MLGNESNLSFVGRLSKHLFGFCFNSFIHFIFMQYLSLAFHWMLVFSKKKMMIGESDEKIWQGKIWKIMFSILFSNAWSRWWNILNYSHRSSTLFFSFFPFLSDGCWLCVGTEKKSIEFANRIHTRCRPN